MGAYIQWPIQPILTEPYVTCYEINQLTNKLETSQPSLLNTSPARVEHPKELAPAIANYLSD
jgi:hypothetical protein